MADSSEAKSTSKQARTAALEHHLTRLENRLRYLNWISNRYAWARLITFVIGAVATGTSFYTLGVLPGISVTILWLASFITLARYHNRVKQSIQQYTLWTAIKTTHLARMRLDWTAIPPQYLGVSQPAQPLEIDLDLIGEHSLHRLVDISVSREGSRRLRSWLATSSPDPAIIQQRQALVREMAPMVLFRDKLKLNATLASAGIRQSWEGKHISAWLEQTASVAPVSKNLLLLLFALAAVSAVLFILSNFANLPAYWLLPFMAYISLYLWKVQRLGDPFELALAVRDPLNDLRAVFQHLETYPYGKHENVQALCSPFLAESRPSVYLKRIDWILAAASVRRNPILWSLISAIIPWDILVMYWLDRSRAAMITLLPGWLDIWFELEALCSLANFAYLNPDYVFPSLTSQDRPAIFEAKTLGHPLIPDRERVCNDFTMRQLGDLIVITGSNMSGKSTFLRTLGINLCLTYAGGPVNARALETIPFRLFTCIRVADSVTDGISYFYAEVKRLKALLLALEEDHPYPLFFLIDEIFRGTNNRERLIGSRSYIRALAGKHGAGVISTHDLELVRLADEISQIKNYHFTETITDGRMLFDYILRPGPSPSTNALKIMWMEGLPVEAEAVD